VDHSFLGAALFFLFADYYNDSLKGNCSIGKVVPFLTRDLANHHGTLGNLDYDEPPWVLAWRSEALKETDFEGLAVLVCQYLPDACPPWAGEPSRIAGELKKARKKWFRYVNKLGCFTSNIEIVQAAKECLRTGTGRFIAADRFHAGALKPVEMTREDAVKALQCFHQYCLARREKLTALGADAITVERQRCQDEAEKSFLDAPDKVFYMLQLPTGLGKTLTGLKTSLLAADLNGKKRIIYVAPYLSILSQAASEIENSTGLEVLQHHHLSVADKSDFDEKDYLVMESWQAPVVVTSFNQFFTALFPRRAQHTLRLNATDEAFIIIDEPQIINQGVWNLFLVMLEALALKKGMQVLLMTATMPPVQVLQNRPYPLVPVVSVPNRFSVHIKQEKWDSESLPEQVLRDCLEHGSTAVILNTIADAAQLFQQIIKTKGDAVNCFNLHGAMHPLHKTHQINAIKTCLENKEATLAVTTQIIEAGVDLSFQSLWRARPVLPSVVQAAGRANRHGAEHYQAVVKVFDYLRDGRETRHYVYRDSIAREETDLLLNPKTTWSEREINPLVEQYYQQYFHRQPGTAALDLLHEAAVGLWDKLSGINPFEESGIQRVPVFVPIDAKWVGETLSNLMNYFDFSNPGEIYDQYVKSGWLGSLSFVDRKRFMALMQQFTVSVNQKLARRVGVNLNQLRSIYHVTSIDEYSPQTGFGHLIGHEDESIYI